MGQVKKDALAIAKALSDAEIAANNPMGSMADVKAKLKALHEALRRGLYSNREVLGLSDAEVSEIDAFGPRAQGGGPKNPPEGG